MNNNKIKKVGSIFANVLLYVFLFLCICSLVLTLFSRDSADDATELFGYQMRIVTSNSMEECNLTDVSDYDIGSIPVNSMIFVKTMPEDPEKADEWYRSLKKGDVLTFRYVYRTQVTITHRIVHIEEKKTGGFIIELAGDNKDSDSDQLTQIIDTSIPNNTNYVIGKVTGQSYVFGTVMSFLKSQVGMIFAIILPCAIIILLEVLKIFRVISAEKQERLRKQMEEQARMEVEEQSKEIEELRRKIELLEKEKDASAPATVKEEKPIEAKEDIET